MKDRVPALVGRMREEIRRGGPLSFARFMELALYDPAEGYYSRGEERLGPGGDFVTAADVGADFGRCLAHQASEIDRASGPFDPFDVVEFGAGRGRTTGDLLDALAGSDPALAARARVLLVDRSAAMRAAARAAVPGAEVVAPEEAGCGRQGLLFAVELFDALPAHRVRRRDGELFEVCVGLGAGGEQLVEVERPAPPALCEEARRWAAAAEDGSEAELTPAAREVLGAMAAAIDRGVILVFDYGDRAPALYGPARRRGTLLAYLRHATSEDYLARIGEQDLTAHVNFSALEEHARRLGLVPLGLVTQDRFLIANGILDAFAQPDEVARHDPRRVKRRLQALQLIHPQAMGRRFKVLALAKNCAPGMTLDGMRDPFERRG
jgi:SAM-dependent MidA family methyltransferase